MKKIVCFFILINSFFVKSINIGSQSQYVSKSYIVLDAATNKVIEGNNIHLVRSVASVSKIMTAIVAIEKGELDKQVTIIKEDLDTYGSSVYLQEGEVISLRDLIYGLLLRSGNDASLAIARAIGGELKEFVRMMNDKAKEIGMNNSLFNNPSGLDVNEEGNLSSAYDLAILMSYSIKNKTFLEISGTKEYKTDKRVWKNKNKLLHSYDKLLAGKTGFTYKARRTLVTAAKDKDTSFIVVTLDCGNDFNFHRFLYEKNFNKYETIKILSKGDNIYEEYIVRMKDDLYFLIEKSKSRDYSLLYLIETSKVTIYLVTNKERIKIGNGEIVKNEYQYKENLWDKIKKLVT